MKYSLQQSCGRDCVTKKINVPWNLRNSAGLNKYIWINEWPI